jgi:hypothetical protein
MAIHVNTFKEAQTIVAGGRAFGLELTSCTTEYAGDALTWERRNFRNTNKREDFWFMSQELGESRRV